jgi:hypothetical protein
MSKDVYCYIKTILNQIFLIVSNKTQPLKTKTNSTQQTNIISNQNIAPDTISQPIQIVKGNFISKDVDGYIKYLL